MGFPLPSLNGYLGLDSQKDSLDVINSMTGSTISPDSRYSLLSCPSLHNLLTYAPHKYLAQPNKRHVRKSFHNSQRSQLHKKKKNAPSSFLLSKHQPNNGKPPETMARNHQLYQLHREKDPRKSQAHHNSQDQCSGSLMNLKDFLQDNDAIARNEGHDNGQESQDGNNFSTPRGIFDVSFFGSKSLGGKCQWSKRLGKFPQKKNCPPIGRH